MEKKEMISLSSGNGGKEMNSLVNDIKKDFLKKKFWNHEDDDGAILNIHIFDKLNNLNRVNVIDNINKKSNRLKNLVFTSDSYTVKPLFFNGGNIGKLSICGTINDLLVMGGEPIGISLNLIIEEGLEKSILDKIIKSINLESKKINVPIVTGDTKIVEKGSIDKIMISTSAIGFCEEVIDKKIEKDDVVIISGGIGEHGIALLSKRFNFETDIKSDCKSLIEEMKEIKEIIKFAKDPTRGGLSSSLNEIAEKKNIEIEIIENLVPIKKEVKKASELFGLNLFELANEGKILLICSEKDSNIVLEKLKKFNPMAEIIGKVLESEKKGKVKLKTDFGTRILEIPSGKIVPRIC